MTRLVPVIRTDRLLPGYYVMDEFAAYIEEARVSGPFLYAEEAERDRVERNIAGDCTVYKVVPLRTVYATRR